MGYNLTLMGIDGDWKFSVDTKTIIDNYVVSQDDYFIGAKIESARTVILPDSPSSGTMIILKLTIEKWGPEKTLTVTTSDGTLIDGETRIVMTRPNQTIQLLYHGDRWNILARYG